MGFFYYFLRQLVVRSFDFFRFGCRFSRVYRERVGCVVIGIQEVIIVCFGCCYYFEFVCFFYFIRGIIIFILFERQELRVLGRQVIWFMRVLGIGFRVFFCSFFRFVFLGFEVCGFLFLLSRLFGFIFRGRRSVQKGMRWCLGFREVGRLKRGNLWSFYRQISCQVYNLFLW